MANLFDTALLSPKNFTEFSSGILLRGVFYNGTIFDGPGLMRFKCEVSGRVFNDFEKWMIFIAVLFLAICKFLLAGYVYGEHKMAIKIAKCKNEQERIDLVNRILNRDLDRPLETWPGEDPRTTAFSKKKRDKKAWDEWRSRQLDKPSNKSSKKCQGKDVEMAVVSSTIQNENKPLGACPGENVEMVVASHTIREQKTWGKWMGFRKWE